MTTVFRDGFESGNFSAWAGTWFAEGSANVCTVAARYGSQGLRVALPPGRPSGIADIWTHPAGLVECWARFSLRVASFGGSEEDAAHAFILWDSTGAVNTLCGLTLRRHNGIRLHLRYKDLRTGEAFMPPMAGAGGAMITGNEWHLIELYGKADAGNGEVRLFLDGVEVAAATGLVNHLCVVNEMSLVAVNTAGKSGGMTLDLDEVALGLDRQGPLRGFRVYDNRGAGCVDYDSPRSVLDESALAWTSDTLSCPARWRFGVRAFNEFGEEKNLNVATELTLLGSGSPSPAGPNRPTDLAARAAEGGRVELTFAYDSTAEAAACSHFHVYASGATGEVDYTSAIDAVVKDDGGTVTHYSFLADPFADGIARRFAVRAATAGDVEDDGTEFVEAVPDATAPAQPSSLVATVVR